MHTNVDGKSTFDLGNNPAFNDPVFFIDAANIVPYLYLGGLLFGKNNFAVFVLVMFQKNINLITDLRNYVAFFIFEFSGGYLTFRLIAYIHHYKIVGHLNDATAHDLAFLDAFEAFFIKRLKGFLHEHLVLIP